MNLTAEERIRYARHTSLDLVGEDGQLLLKKARVLIVGVGGLGCPAALYLAAAGVGVIGLIDHDVVSASNLQRQILFTTNDIGRSKVQVASERLRALNPNVEIRAYNEALSTQNALAVFNDFEIILDGTDNFQSKYLINDTCILLGKPMVSASIHKFQGQLSVFNYQNGPSYRCLFPEYHGEDPNNCEAVGVIGVLPGILGTMQAVEVIKIILGLGKVLSGKLKLVDTLTMEDQMIEFDRQEIEIEKVKSRGLESAALVCDDAIDIKYEVVYLDVRAANEMPKMQEGNVICIPMDQLSARYDEIPTDVEVIVCCQTGKRSQQAIAYLEMEFGFENLKNLEGGIMKLIK
jgi:sulfur-carrier protein adenylyltransferase/sulfurtransferase